MHDDLGGAEAGVGTNREPNGMQLLRLRHATRPRGCAQDDSWSCHFISTLKAEILKI
jgi:hypothetical protein